MSFLTPPPPKLYKLRNRIEGEGSDPSDSGGSDDTSDAAGACGRGGGSDRGGTDAARRLVFSVKVPCEACGEEVDMADTQDHPWLYERICPSCHLKCKELMIIWAAGGSAQCVQCAAAGVAITVLNGSLTCRNCLRGDERKSAPQLRHDWKEKFQNFQIENGFQLEKIKPPLRVLSLFDGIGTGLLVLDNLGLEVEEYFSSEIDDNALSVLDYRFYGRMTHLGSVTNLSPNKLNSLGRIDLLIGGSPCNQLSLANPLRKGLYDVEDTGSVFFDYNRILKFLQASDVHRETPLYWLFENVASMPHDFRDTISKTFQCQPAKWDAGLFLPAKRARLFWGNIPNLHADQTTDKPPPYLDHILEPYRKAQVTTLPTITTTFHSQCGEKRNNASCD